jgi:hypothetical protein
VVDSIVKVPAIASSLLRDMTTDVS